MSPKQTTPKREASFRLAIDPSDLSDTARRLLVKSDARRKQAAKAFANISAAVPAKLMYRAVPEIERLRAAARSG